MRYLILTLLACGALCAAENAKSHSDTPKVENAPTARGIAPNSLRARAADLMDRWKNRMAISYSERAALWLDVQNVRNEINVVQGRAVKPVRLYAGK